MFRKTFLPPVANLLAFEAVARRNSVSRAADELHLTQSAVSRQIHQLETQLGVTMFHRVRQRVVLSEAGRAYAAEVRILLHQLSDATRRTMACTQRDELNLAVLPTLGTRWLIPRLGDFMALKPEVTINFTSRTLPFEFSKEPFDAAIHFGAPDWAGAVCEYLMHEEVIVVCSPALQRLHRIRQIADLSGVVLLHQMSRAAQWASWLEQHGANTAQALRGPQFEQVAMLAQAAASGLGAALLPRFLVERELSSGELIQLFPQALNSTDAYYFVYPQSLAQAPLVREFGAWILGQCRAAADVPQARA